MSEMKKLLEEQAAALRRDIEREKIRDAELGKILQTLPCASLQHQNMIIADQVEIVAALKAAFELGKHF